MQMFTDRLNKDTSITSANFKRDTGLKQKLQSHFLVAVTFYFLSVSLETSEQ